MAKIKLVFWIGKEFGEDFKPVSEIRSFLEVDAEDGSTGKTLFVKLTDSYSQIDRKLFCNKTQSFCHDIVITFNDRFMARDGLCDRSLQENDKITILSACMWERKGSRTKIHIRMKR